MQQHRRGLAAGQEAAFDDITASSPHVTIILASHCHGLVCLLDPDGPTLWVSQEFDRRTQRRAVARALHEFEARTQRDRPGLTVLPGGRSSRN